MNTKENILLNYVRLLTEESKYRFCTLLHQYVFKLKNSKSFREKCARQDISGFNSFAIWMEKHNFSSSFKNYLDSDIKY